MCIHAYEDIPAFLTQLNVCTMFFKYESMYVIMYSIPVYRKSHLSLPGPNRMWLTKALLSEFYSSKKCQNAEIQMQFIMDSV